jgi:hypothetical protein
MFMDVINKEQQGERESLDLLFCVTADFGEKFVRATERVARGKEAPRQEENGTQKHLCLACPAKMTILGCKSVD